MAQDSEFRLPLVEAGAAYPSLEQNLLLQLVQTQLLQHGFCYSPEVGSRSVPTVFVPMK